MRRLGIISIVLSGLPIATFVGAQQPPPPAAATPRFPTVAEAVALDLVVRDRKGRLVTDLQPGEIEVLEDGVPQKLTLFRSITAGAGSATPASPTSSPSTPVATSAVPALASARSRRVVLAFGRLGAEGRRLAQAAGDEFARRYVPDTTVTVVRIDGGLIPVLAGSADPAAVKEAVHKATAAVGASALRPGGPVGADNSYSGQQLSRFEGGAGARDLAQSDSVVFVNALHGIVDDLRADAGRKTVLVFSEGFIAPPGYEQVFAELLSRANRANVSFYGIDVRGLQLTSQLDESRAALASATALSEQQRNAGSGGSPATRDQMTQDDVTQASVRSDAVDTLANLSASTGGFLVTQTNDFGRPLARIAEDLRGYYEASYTPSAAPAPGQFRRIEVRVARKDVRVQSRSGYYTSPPAPASAAAALDALSAAQLPDDFEVRSRFYRFAREGNGAFDCVLKLEASLAKAEFRQDPGPSGRLTGKMVLAGRVLDASGVVVDSFGQEVALGGTPEQIQAARAQTLPLARRLRLAHGKYTIELVVRDAVGNTSSARRFTVVVPEPEGPLGLSSLVVVSGVDAADPKSDPTDPLRIGDQRIVPNLGSTVVPSPGGVLPVYYNVYVEPGSKDLPTAAVEVSREGRVIARGAPPLPAPDAQGRIQGLSPIPLSKLTPGRYVIKVTVTRGSLSTEETTTVSVGS